MKEDLALTIMIIKCKFHKATMSHDQLTLYETVSSTLTSDTQKREATYTVPSDANPKDLKRVKRQIELEGGLYKKVFVTGGPSSSFKKPPQPPII